MDLEDPRGRSLQPRASEHEERVEIRASLHALLYGLEANRLDFGTKYVNWNVSKSPTWPSNVRSTTPRDYYSNPARKSLKLY